LLAISTIAAHLWAHVLRTNGKFGHPIFSLAACVDQLRPLTLSRERHQSWCSTFATLTPAKVVSNEHQMHELSTNMHKIEMTLY